MGKFIKYMVVLSILTFLLAQSTVLAAEGDVARIGDIYYDSLETAVDDAHVIGESTNDTVIVEVIDDTEITSTITISSDIKIINSGDEHSVTLDGTNNISVIDGGILTLGDGIEADPLTISNSNSGASTVNATGGTVYILNGIVLENTAGSALTLNGSGVNSIISGGSIIANVYAIDLENGASISRISSGYFQSNTSNAVYVNLGSHIGEISGGEFVGGPSSSGSLFLRTYSAEASSLDTISGGYFHGGNIGVYLISYVANYKTQIGSITGGTFEGTQYGIYIGVSTQVNEISGGTYTGDYGILNRGTLSDIGGTVLVTGTGSYAMYNSSNGTIEEISGGTYISTDSQGSSLGATEPIELISGGTFIGEQHAVVSGGTGTISIETISGGVFLGKNSSAVSLQNSNAVLELEPDLTDSQGVARFSGYNGVVFDNEERVEYPVNSQFGAYYMSDDTKTVEGLEGYNFKYLMLSAWSLEFDANIPIGADGSGVTVPSAVVISDDNDSDELVSPEGTPTTDGGIYSFAGWNTSADGSETPYSQDDIVPAHEAFTIITLYAQWTFTPNDPDPETYTVSYDANGGEGQVPVDDTSYTSGSSVTVLGQGDLTRDNYEFMGWSVSEAGDVDFLPNATFTISDNVTLYAVWEVLQEEKKDEDDNNGSESDGDDSNKEATGSDEKSNVEWEDAIVTVIGEDLSSISQSTLPQIQSVQGSSAETADNIDLLWLMIALVTSALTCIGIFVCHKRMGT